MNTKITVIIPTYRRPELLMNCLSALAKQEMTKQDFQVIVVSDGPDALTHKMTAQAVIKHRMDIRFLSLPEKKGPAAARNLGWQLAMSPLVAFTDDDCIPEPMWLERIWDTYVKLCTPELVAFSGKLKVPLSEEPTDFALNTSNLETAEFVTANCACTKKALATVGGFDTRFSMAWREDSDLQFKFISQKIPIYKVSAALVKHPVRKAPWGVSLLEQKKSYFNALLYKKFPRLYRQRIQSAPAWNYYVIILSFLLLFAALFTGKFALALIMFLFYLLFMIAFIVRRLKMTSKSFSHVSEMITTSFLIPFVSVFWTLNGALRYRVLFF